MGTSDLGHAAKMFCLSESLETILQADGVSDGRKIQGDVPEWINCGGDTLTYLTDNVTLKFPGEYCVHDAGTLGGLDAGFVDQMSVQQVQGGDEELMSILLLITSKVMSMGPNHVEKFVRREWSFGISEEFLEKLRDFTNNAGVFTGGLAHVAVG